MPDLVLAGSRATLRPRPSTLDDVDIRLVDLDLADDAVVRAEAWLTPLEIARARRGTPAVRRRRVLLRAALRSALADVLGTDPADVPLETTAAGRPFVGGTDVDVSCSASGPLGVVAIGRGGRLGIDVERIAPWSAAVLEEGWLSDIEQLALGDLADGARASAATRSWTQKEAVLKALGTGLRTDPSTIVTPVGRGSGVVAGWHIHDVPVREGWISSLAVAPERGMSS